MRHTVLAATTAGLILIGALPATSLAAPVMQFGNEVFPLIVGSNCISGRGPTNGTVHVVWKAAGGAVKAVADETINLNGYWMHCSATRKLAVGDTISAASGAFARTFTMPNITLHGNRETFIFRGIGLPNRTGELLFHAGRFADFFHSEPVSAGADGRWSYFDGAFGGIEAGAFWSNQQGDMTAARIVVPFVEVTIGRAMVNGGTRAFGDAVVRLRDPLTNALRGTALDEADDWGFFDGAFRDSEGDLVEARVGDRVVSPIAHNLDWHIPEVEGTANVASDVVNGQCHSTEIRADFVVVRIFRSGNEVGLAAGSLDDSGEFSMDFNGEPDLFYDPANIRNGDRVVVECYHDTGDVVRLPFRAP